MKKVFLMLAACAAAISSLWGANPTLVPLSPPENPPTHPAWARTAVIYEINTRQYSHEGNFSAIIKDLPRLKEMGVDILWLMPIHPIGELNRKGGLGSPYSVQDYRAVHPDYGTMDDFKALVKNAHELGMKVIIDWVANHSAWDNKQALVRPDWYMHKADGSFESPFDWTDVIKFDYRKPAMRKYMIESMQFWLKEADIDGFRCDVAMEVPVDFWQECATALRATKKDIFLLAEAQEPKLHNRAFNASYAWGLLHTNNGIYKGEKQLNDIDTEVMRGIKEFKPGFMMNFITNHDENSWNGTEFERYGDAVKAFAALTFTLPGMPLIYNGQEAALDRRLAFFEKDPIEWSNYPMMEYYTRLAQFKHKNPEALAADNTNFTRLATGNDKEIYAFTRVAGDKKVLVVINFSKEYQSVKLPDEVAGAYLQWTEKEELPVKIAPSEEIKVGPWEAQLFMSK